MRHTIFITFYYLPIFLPFLLYDFYSFPILIFFNLIRNGYQRALLSPGSRLQAISQICTMKTICNLQSNTPFSVNFLFSYRYLDFTRNIRVSLARLLASVYNKLPEIDCDTTIKSVNFIRSPFTSPIFIINLVFLSHKVSILATTPGKELSVKIVETMQLTLTKLILIFIQT